MKYFANELSKKAIRFSVLLLIVAPLGVTQVPLAARAADWDSPIQVAKDIGSFLKNSITAGATSATAVSTGSLSVAYQARKGPLGSGIGLDTIAWQVGKIAIQMMTKSMVNWINSGFHGSPAFVSNLSDFLLNVGDVAAGQFIHDYGINNAVMSPFRTRIAIQLSNNYYRNTGPYAFYQQYPYTLSRYIKSDEAFLNGEFSQGGWSGWFAASQYPQNNPYGAGIIASDELIARVRQAGNTETLQLGWGQGFLAWCGDNTGPSVHEVPVQNTANTVTSQEATLDGSQGASQTVTVPSSNSAAPVNLSGTANPQVTHCLNKDGTIGAVQTPGTVIRDQINKTLGLSGDTLVTADEFDEVIGALMSQLVTQVVGGTGLGGVASVSSGGRGYIDAATDPTQITQATNAANANATFVDGITSEIASLQQYQANWGTISDAADAAKTALASCSTANADQVARVNAVSAQAAAALAKGAAALTAAGTIGTDATNAVAAATTGANGSSGTAAVAAVTANYQAFLASPSTPSAADISYAAQQSADNAAEVANGGVADQSNSKIEDGVGTVTDVTPTLYTEMQQAATSCAA